MESLGREVSWRLACTADFHAQSYPSIASWVSSTVLVRGHGHGVVTVLLASETHRRTAEAAVAPGEYTQLCPIQTSVPGSREGGEGDIQVEIQMTISHRSERATAAAGGGCVGVCLGPAVSSDQGWDPGDAWDNLCRPLEA